jgi:hypothetical protein
MKRLIIAIFLFLQATIAHANPTYGLRLLTHFHKNIYENGIGVAGWVIIPDVTSNPAMPIFLIGPKYQGKGYWVELMAGPRINKSVLAANPDADPVAWVQSTRFQVTPEAIGQPVNIWGNLQFIDLTGENTIPYLFLMADYILPQKVALVGIETENYFNAPYLNGEHDIGIGPQLIIPFKGLNIIAAYQFHLHENANDQIWFRAMYDFPSPK